MQHFQIKLCLSTLLFFIACQTCPNIVESDYSQKTPKDTFDKIKASVECDEIDWAWNTLSTSTRNKVSYTEFVAGWNTHSSEIAMLKKAQRLSSEEYAYKLPAEKLTIQNGAQTQAFLFVQEGRDWYLEFPSPWENDFSFLEPKKSTP